VSGAREPEMLAEAIDRALETTDTPGEDEEGDEA
jgi:hypothetical protein